jgi:SEC-C motif domain protein
MKNNNDLTCPCHSKKLYINCCKVFHDKSKIPNPQELMRSRYSAYAMTMPDYIIETTHKNSTSFHKDINKWKSQIIDFCKTTDFYDLKIHHFISFENQAFVTFTAFLKNGDKDITFTEKSTFIKENGRWYYLNGEIVAGAPSIDELKELKFI